MITAPHNMSVILARMVLATTALLLTACSIWTEWEQTPRQKDPPYVQGKRSIPMGRTTSCLMCTTGRTGEYAFFGQGARFSRPYYPRDVALKALALVRQSPDVQWTIVGKDVIGTPESFAPIRIIVISADPLLVAAVPWQYKTPIRDGSSYTLGDEVKPFIENNSNGERWISHAWIAGLRNVVELRGTLPKGAAQVTLISKKSRVALDLPATPLETNSALIDGQRVTFTRAEQGHVDINFAAAAGK